ncbi:MAG: DNA gyrase inhibitor YacG [Alphaproteobacteria bacterium]|nr:DNA gyrase inhibitor YacG [Alphaproteobacteria bacterium]
MSAPNSKCPICQKPAEYDTRPFCSKGCKLLDLNRWLNGSYAIPTQEEPSFEDLEHDLEGHA